MILVRFAPILFLGLIAGSACAQDADVITPPRPLPADTREKQMDVVGEPREGIVILNFTVKADGSTDDIKVVGGFYNDWLQKAFVRQVSRRKYEPARVRGEPVDFYGLTQVQMLTYHLGMVTVTPELRRDHARAMALLQSGDAAGAEPILQNLLQHKIRGLFEFAFLSESLVPIYLKLDRPYEALLASRQATLRDGPQEVVIPLGSRIRTNDPGWPYLLPREMVLPALKERFAISSALGLTGEALYAYAALNDLDPLPPGDPITARAEALRAQMQTARNLVSRARISKSEWRHALSLRTFTITNVKGGNLTGFDLLCGRERRSLPYKAESEWTMPASWGSCTATFHGDEGTEFAIVELRAPTATGS